MSSLPSSAIITDQGQRVMLRIRGSVYELGQEELCGLLGFPPGPPGLGITVDHERFCFEFTGDQRTMEVSAGQLRSRLGRQITAK